MLISPQTDTVIAERYELTGSIIASGGMSVVYEGRDRVLNRDVAVKMLAEQAALDPSLRQRFHSEALAVARLSHPYVVAIFDAGVHEDRPYIVMERLPGRTFADEVAQGGVPSTRVRRVASNVLEALECAHAAGIIHRDVKPHNVLVATDGSVKLTDFGIAKYLDNDLTRTRDVFGTPAYLAPELLDGEAASARTDVFGVGVMLYEALAGSKPFAGDTPWAVAAAAKAGRFAPLSGLAPSADPALIAAVERAIESDPAARFAGPAEMREALERPASIDPTRVLTLPPSAQGQADQTVQLSAAANDGMASGLSVHARREQRRGLTVIFTAAAIALFIVVAAAMIVTRGDPGPGTTRPPAAPAGTVPTPLRDALIELQRSVTP